MKNNEIANIFHRYKTVQNRPVIKCQNPNPLPDRKALDDIVFDILGLTQAERDEVYWSAASSSKPASKKQGVFE